MSEDKKAEQANHSNVLNPEHPAYYRSRGDSRELAEQKAQAQRNQNQRDASVKKR